MAFHSPCIADMTAWAGRGISLVLPSPLCCSNSPFQAAAPVASVLPLDCNLSILLPPGSKANSRMLHPVNTLPKPETLRISSSLANSSVRTKPPLSDQWELWM